MAFVPRLLTFASPYVDTITRLLDTTPATLKAADAFDDEVYFDLVEALEPRMQELLDAYNALPSKRDELAEKIEAEQDAEKELKAHRAELRKLDARARRRAAALAADEDDDGEDVEADDHADERHQEQLEAHLIPDTEARYAAAKTARVQALTEVKAALSDLLTALTAFDER